MTDRAQAGMFARQDKGRSSGEAGGRIRAKRKADSTREGKRGKGSECRGGEEGMKKEK